VTKPFDPLELTALVANVLARFGTREQTKVPGA